MTQHAQPETRSHCRQSGDHVDMGITLLLVGGFFLIYQIGWIPLTLDWHNIGALFFVIMGTAKIVQFRSLRKTLQGIFFIFIGVWLYACLNGAWGASFQTTWPWILIASGVYTILKALIDKPHTH